MCTFFAVFFILSFVGDLSKITLSIYTGTESFHLLYSKTNNLATSAHSDISGIGCGYGLAVNQAFGLYAFPGSTEEQIESMLDVTDSTGIHKNVRHAPRIIKAAPDLQLWNGAGIAYIV